MQPLQPKTLNHIFFHSVETFDRDPLLVGSQDGISIQFSTGKFNSSVLTASQFLRTSGLHPGDRIAILAESRPEWHIFDFAILLSRMVSVPIYSTLSLTQLRYVLEHSECSAIVVSTQKQWDRIAALRCGLPGLRCVISMEQWPDQPLDIISLPRLLSETAIDQGDSERIREDALAVDPQSVATIVYTSGTTGPPKGVMLTHANIAFDLWQGLRRLQFECVPQALSVLPLSHVFERLLCYGYFMLGIPIAYGDPYQLAEHFMRYRPAAMGCVPRMLEKIQETVMTQIEAMPVWKQRAAGRLLRIGRQHIGKRVRGRRASPSSVVLYSLADLLVYRKIRKRVGGRLQGMICGGGRLDPAVEEFFLAAGFRVLKGYGLTETSPVISLDLPHEIKPGSVGKPLDGIELSFGPDGEILTRGPHVMKGYYKDPESTALALRDGWLLTGDLGTLDDDGYLVITGRKKEMLVTAGGKNISPVLIEAELCRSSIIQEAFVVGDGRKFISAMIIPHKNNLALAVRGKQIQCEEGEHWLESAQVIDLFWQEIQKFQQDFSEHEKVRKFCLLEETVLGDLELFTPTQKVRRSVLEQKYRSRIDQMYRN